MRSLIQLDVDKTLAKILLL